MKESISQMLEMLINWYKLHMIQIMNQTLIVMVKMKIKYLI